MGLGLAIGRQAVLREAGTITLANRPEGGLRVQVGLPAREPPHDRNATQDSLDTKPRG